MTTSKTTFIRDATGLVRQFTLADAFGLSVGSYVIMNMLLWPILVGLYAFPGFDFILCLIIGTVFCVFWALIFGLFGQIMPRSGGDYTYVTRTFNPAIGFGSSFAFTMIVVITILGIGGTTWTGLSFGLSSYLDAVGRMTSNPGLVTLGESIVTGYSGFLIGTVIILIGIAINMFSARLTSWCIRILLATSMITMLIPFVIFATSTNAQYIVSFNSFATRYYNGTTYQGILTAAQSKGWTPSSFSMTNTLLALPLVFLGYLGFGAVSAAGSEIKRPQKTLMATVILAIVAGFAYSAFGWTVMQNAVGYDFMSAASYLSNTGYLPLPAYFATPFFLAAPIYPNVLVITLTVYAFVVQNTILYCLVLALNASRYMFAWSFDRILPAAVADVSDRFHTPIKSLIVVAILAIGTLALFAFEPFLTVYFNVLITVWISQVILGVAAAVFPYWRKDIFNSAPSSARMRVGKVPFLTICGIVTAVGMSIAAVTSFFNPLVIGPTGPSAFALGAALYVGAIAWYYIIKYYRRKQGIDLGMIFKAIPPE